MSRCPCPTLAAGLRGACAVPILQGGKAVGVLECFAREARPRDEEVVRALVAVGGDAAIDGLLRTTRILTGMLTVVLSVLLAWLAKKLMAPEILAEFRR